MNEYLKSEVEYAIHILKSRKAAEPDVISIEFLMTSDDFTKILNKMYETGEISKD